MRRPLIMALALAAASLALVGCGGGDAPEVSTAADGSATATLKTKDGDTWTVTLAEGQTEAFDVYGNYGNLDGPISIWQIGAGPISQAKDSLFAIGLPQSASTGYTWRAAGGTADGGVVELVEQGVNTKDPGLPGSAGTHYFVYRATTAGSGTLEFQQFAPGSETPETTEKFDVTVTG